MKGKKRYIGILMCLCMLVGMWQPAVLSSAKSEVATPTSTNTSSYIWNGENMKIYYADDFADSVGYNAALGSYADNQYAMSWDADNQRLCYPSDATLDAGVALFKGMSNASKLQDYTIEADVMKGSVNQYVALIAYGSEYENQVTNGYEFALVKNGTSETVFRLGYRKNGSFTTLKDADGNNLQINVKRVEGLGVTTNLVGEEILMRMNAITNEDGNVELKCYATYKEAEVLIFECVADASVTGITCGAPGVRTHSKGTTIDNIRVAQTRDTIIYYADDFSDSVGYDAALGSYADNQYAMSWDADNQRLCYPSDETLDAAVALFNGLDNASQMQNYTIEADVMKGSVNQYVALIAYGSEYENQVTNGYEFALVKNGTSETVFRLGYRKNGSFTSLKDAEGNNLQINVKRVEGLGITTNLVGEEVLMRMNAITNEDGNVELKCYATYKGAEVLVFECIADASVTGITCGAPGVRTHSKGTTIDNISVTQPVDDTILYADSFSGTLGYTVALGNYAQSEYVLSWDKTNQRLNYPSNATKNAGVALFNGLPIASTMQNYTVSADVVKGELAQYAALIAYGSEGTDDGQTNGYEFALVKNGTSNTVFRLGYRKDGGFTTLKDAGGNNLQINVKNVEGLDITDNLVGEQITMRMSANTSDVGNVELKCYATYKSVEVLVFECVADGTVTGITQGVPGFRTHSKGTTIDNICVKTMATIENTPDGPDNPNEPEKEVVVLPFVETFDDTTKIANRWNIGSQITIQNGQALLGVTGDVTSKMYLTGVQDTDKWTNYVYEADVTVLEETIPNGATNTMAAIVAAANENNEGYEFGVLYTPATQKYQARLYDRITKTTLASTTYEFQYGIPMKMKMVVTGNTIQCYIDGEKILQSQVSGGTKLAGSIGILAGGKQALFDNLSVTEFTGDINADKATAPVANEEGIYYFDNFNKGVRVVDGKWETKVLDISNQSLLMNGNTGTHYLTGDEGFLLLKDYTVSAKVIVDAENNVNEKTIIGAIVARTEGESSGYEFGICYTGDRTYLRLYDRTAKKQLARNNDIALELGKEYLLTMVCEGNEITCYLDNEKVFSIVDNTNISGTAGVRTIGTVYYDDFVVAVPEYAKKLGYVSNGGNIVASPSTGDNNYDMPTLWGILAISLFCIVTVMTLQKKRKGEEML